MDYKPYVRLYLTCVKMWSEVLPHQWAFPLYAMAYVCVACHTL